MACGYLFELLHFHRLILWRSPTSAARRARVVSKVAIGKAEKAIAKELGDENAKAQKDTRKPWLKDSFDNKQADS